MKVAIAGGSGSVGAILIRHFNKLGEEVVVLSRGKTAEGVRTVTWDGVSVGAWVQEIEDADAVINLAGRSVNCRYTRNNLDEMMSSRVLSTRAIGEAIAGAKHPPKVWLQASTATIYAHRFDAPNDEASGIIGGAEQGAPYKWSASIAIAKAWEAELEAAKTPATRKVAMRSAMTMSPDRGSVFDVMARLATWGLGGPVAGGRQYVSWIHEYDFAAAVSFLIEREDLAGAINICSPNPLPQREFARILREALGVRVGLPLPAWALEVGAVLMRTETELILKSRRVVPTRLLGAGFKFQYPEWRDAAKDLAAHWVGGYGPAQSG